MAVQLPNFLGVPIQQDDYSGLADLFQNYYAGKDLPRQSQIREYQAKGAPLDYLMKQIQAEFARPKAEEDLTGAKLGNQIKQVEADFARPNAEQSLTGSKLENVIRQVQSEFARPNAEQNLAGLKLGNQSTGLSNRQAEMTIKKLQQELANEARMQAAISQGTGQSNDIGGVKGAVLKKGLADVMNDQAMKNQPTPMGAPLIDGHPADAEIVAPQSQMQELDAGSPAHYGLDKMWENEPQMRPYMKKAGHEKVVTDEYDKKTGQTRVKTVWPSKRITVKTIMPQQEKMEGNEAPLTKTSLSKVENEIRGTDSLLPYLDELIELSRPRKVVEGVNTSKIPYFTSIFGFETPGNTSATYHKTVKKALESYAGSSTLPRTNESMQTVHDILSRSPGESDQHYHDELVKEKKAQLEKRAKNLQLMKKGINKFGNTASSNQSYSSDEWETADEK